MGTAPVGRALDVRKAAHGGPAAIPVPVGGAYAPAW